MTDDVDKLPAGHGVGKERRLALLEMVAAGCWHPEAFEMAADESFEDRAGFGNENSKNRRSRGRTS